MIGGIGDKYQVCVYLVTVTDFSFSISLSINIFGTMLLSPKLLLVRVHLHSRNFTLDMPPKNIGYMPPKKNEKCCHKFVIEEILTIQYILTQAQPYNFKSNYLDIINPNHELCKLNWQKEPRTFAIAKC